MEHAQEPQPKLNETLAFEYEMFKGIFKTVSETASRLYDSNKMLKHPKKDKETCDALLYRLLSNMYETIFNEIYDIYHDDCTNPKFIVLQIAKPVSKSKKKAKSKAHNNNTQDVSKTLNLWSVHPTPMHIPERLFIQQAAKSQVNEAELTYFYRLCKYVDTEFLIVPIMKYMLRAQGYDAKTVAITYHFQSMLPVVKMKGKDKHVSKYVDPSTGMRTTTGLKINNQIYDLLPIVSAQGNYKNISASFQPCITKEFLTKSNQELREISSDFQLFLNYFICNDKQQKDRLLEKYNTLVNSNINLF